MKGKVKPIPEGYRTLTPYFSVRGADRFIEFLKNAFGARDTYVIRWPSGEVMSAEVQVGDSRVMVGEDDGEQIHDTPMRCMLYMYVSNADAVYAKAIRAGAKSVMGVDTQFWGDRCGVVEDLVGNQWWIATHKEELDAAEILRRVQTSEDAKPAKGKRHAEKFRRIALGMPGVIEGRHMHHPDFRVKGRIFATIHADQKWGMVALTPDEQQRLVRDSPADFTPENGSWGRAGCTKVRLDSVDEEVLGEAITLAWQHAASKAGPKPRGGRRK
jgi:uncharacterized glyoxalase superfamily protein PhnB